jgi:hypothetical protein
MISGFCHVVDEVCALLGYNTAWNGNSVWMFGDKVSKSKKHDILTLEDGTSRFS